MRAELRGLDSADALDGVERFAPSDPDSFVLAVAAHVGPVGEEGDELFYFTICTPRWLLEHPAEKGFLFPRHYLLVNRWEYPVVLRAIRDVCHHAEGKTWDEVAKKVARYGHWEFEDYRDL